MTHITLAPINLNSPRSRFGKIGRDNYVLEMRHFGIGDGINPRWDDSRHNTSRVGDFFGFVDAKRKIVEIFDIIDILPATERPPHWSIEEQQDKQVLVLSKSYMTEPWRTFKERVGYTGSHIQCTMRMRLR